MKLFCLMIWLGPLIQEILETRIRSTSEPTFYIICDLNSPGSRGESRLLSFLFFSFSMFSVFAQSFGLSQIFPRVSTYHDFYPAWLGVHYFISISALFRPLLFLRPLGFTIQTLDLLYTPIRASFPTSNFCVVQKRAQLVNTPCVIVHTSSW